VDRGFRLAGCFERLKRAGRFVDVLIDGPFDPEGAVAVKLTEAEWRSVKWASTPRDASHGPHDFSLNELAARPSASLAPKPTLRAFGQNDENAVFFGRLVHYFRTLLGARALAVKQTFGYCWRIAARGRRAGFSAR
jgi:hypothetical protein